jgi:putative ABC transport system permease protein
MVLPEPWAPYAASGGQSSSTRLPCRMPTSPWSQAGISRAGGRGWTKNYLIYGLLGLAIVIAVLGIVNTLALSVIERTREVGLLRAVGLSRRQLRRMVRLEAIAIAVLGAVLGIVMGIGFGVVLQQAIKDQGVTDLAVPAGRLVAFVVVAAVVGVLAAVFPARRAARLNVLQAITTE